MCYEQYTSGRRERGTRASTRRIRRTAAVCRLGPVEHGKKRKKLRPVNCVPQLHASLLLHTLVFIWCVCVCVCVCILNRYEGEYVDSMQTGYGLMTWADGRRYEGYWVNSKCTGFGTLTHKDGRRYEGQYVNDKMQGHGIYVEAKL